MSRTFMFRLLAASALALLPASSAMAAAFAPQIWAIGNGSILADILRATKSMMNEGGYERIIEMIALVAFIFVATSAGMFAVKPGRVIIYFVTIVLVVAVTFRAHMNITVFDPVNQTTEVVGDVPLVVGLPVTMTSALGDWFLRAVETFFSYPDVGFTGTSPVSMRGSGQFNIIGQMVADGTKIKIHDQYISASMHAYVQDCVVPWMVKGYINTNEIMESKNLWKDLYNNSRSMTTLYYSDTYKRGVLVPCGSNSAYDGTFSAARNTPDPSGTGTGPFGYPNLAADPRGAHERIADDIKTNTPRLVGQGFDGYQYTNANSFFDKAYSAGTAFLTNGTNTLSTQELVRNNAVINSFRDTSRDVMSSMGGGSGAVYAINSSQALQAQKTGWQLAADIFQRVVGYMYTILQAFIMAMMPIAVVAFLVPSFGFKMAGTMVKLMIWLAIWIPALGIANFIIAGYLRNSIGADLSDGITLGNIHSISERTQNAMLAGSFFATSIPLITWGIVSSGSFAVTQFLSEGAGAMHTSQAASAIAAGNVSVNQRSMNNTKANSTDTLYSLINGVQNPTGHQSYGINTMQHGGGVTGDIAGVTSSVSQKMDKSFVKKASIGTMETLMDQVSSATGAERTEAIRDVSQNVARYVTRNMTDAQQRSEASQRIEKNVQASLQSKFDSEQSSNSGFDDGVTATFGLNQSGMGGNQSSKTHNRFKVSEEGGTGGDVKRSASGSDSASSGKSGSAITAASFEDAIDAGLMASGVSQNSDAYKDVHSLGTTETSSDSISYEIRTTQSVTTQKGMSLGEIYENKQSIIQENESGQKEVKGQREKFSNNNESGQQKMRDELQSQREDNSQDLGELRSSNQDRAGQVSGAMSVAQGLSDHIDSLREENRGLEEASSMVDEMASILNDKNISEHERQKKMSNLVGVATEGFKGIGSAFSGMLDSAKSYITGEQKGGTQEGQADQPPGDYVRSQIMSGISSAREEIAARLLENQTAIEDANAYRADHLNRDVGEAQQGGPAAQQMGVANPSASNTFGPDTEKR